MRCNQVLVGAYKLTPFWCIFGVAFLIAGICFCAISTTTVCTKEVKSVYKKHFVYDYTNCTSYDNEDVVCHEAMKQKNWNCICAINNLTIPNYIVGDVVIMYQLEDFNSSKSPDYFLSRDDKQLNGTLSEHPSPACEPFAYDENNRTIAPCGAIADDMFTDSFELSRLLDNDSSETVPTLNHGLLLVNDKRQFANPLPIENLALVFQNYSRPRSWKKNIWELDPTDPFNNGFQNEAFIAWMRTDWDIKPLYRLNESAPGYEHGLPNGNYNLIVSYDYPTYKYDGKRNMIIATQTVVEEESCQSVPIRTYDIGISSLLIGLIFIMITIGLFLYSRTTQPKST